MITIDPYYNVAEYLESLDAMGFNGIDYQEYIDIKSKLWYLNIDSAVTRKCDKCKNDRFLVEKVRPIVDIDEIKIRRKSGDTSLERYLDNDMLTKFKESGLSSCFAFIANANDAARYSIESGANIYWYGNYGTSIGICVSTIMPPPRFKTTMAPVATGLFDIAIRKNLMDYRFFLRKYIKQPYFWAGRFYALKGLKPGDF